jgi:hypothetical protein
MRPKALKRPRQAGLRREIAHVGDNEARLRAALAEPGERPCGLSVPLEVVEHQIAPALGERERDALADAAPAAVTSATGRSAVIDLARNHGAPDPEMDIGRRHGPSGAHRGLGGNRSARQIDEAF